MHELRTAYNPVLEAHASRGQTRRLSKWALSAGLLVACGGEFPDEAPESDEVLIETSASDLAALNASPVSNTVPLRMHPGENLNVTVVMKNTGTRAWDASYKLANYGPAIWNFHPRASQPAPAGSSKPFRFVIRSPFDAGSDYTLGARMQQTTSFGQPALIGPITVDPSVPRRWGCAWDSADPVNNVPTVLTAGQTFLAKFRLRNTGTNPWHKGENRCTGTPNETRGSFFLSQDDKTEVGQFNFWGVRSTQIWLPKDVVSGDFVDITVPITANPNVARTTTYRFARQVFDCRPALPDPNGGVGFLQGGQSLLKLDPCVDLAITVTPCGNGVIDGGDGEQCDDHNRVSGDGCDATCRTEATAG